MKKLKTKESFAGTRISIQDEAGNELTNIDYLSFGANKMDAKLFAGQIVNAWNGTYGEGVDPSSVKDLFNGLPNAINKLGSQLVGEDHKNIMKSGEVHQFLKRFTIKTQPE